MTYEVFRIPLPPMEAHLENYKRLRLLSLMTNPEAFGSTYEREMLFTEEQWRLRLVAQDRTTFIARRGADLRETPSSNNIEEDWVATASVLPEEMLTAAQIAFPACVADGNTSVYAIVGMWVHPEHRRRGLGKQLIDAILESVRKISETAGTQRKTVLLEVHDDNEKAKALYTSFGFVKQEESEPGQSWMALTVV